MLPRVFAARPSPLIAGTSRIVVFVSRSVVRSSWAKASSRAMIRQASRDDGSLPCTLQLTSAVGVAEIAAAVGSGRG